MLSTQVGSQSTQIIIPENFVILGRSLQPLDDCQNLKMGPYGKCEVEIGRYIRAPKGQKH